MPICINKLRPNWISWWSVVILAPCNYLNKWRFIAVPRVRTHFSEISNKIDNFLRKNMNMKTLPKICQLFYSGLSVLTHWGRDKMDAVSQTTLWSAFSSMKMFEFRLKFHWSLFLRANWQSSIIGLDNGLAQSRRQAIIWTNDGQIIVACMRHSASMS